MSSSTSRMLASLVRLAATTLLVTACSGGPPEPPAQPLHRSAGTVCGESLGDWCPPARAGDPCGAHRDEGACRADPRCEGLVYRGESAVPCHIDDRCFASNCPTVGCTMRCEALDETTCEAGRCEWDGQRCSSVRCGPI